MFAEDVAENSGFSRLSVVYGDTEGVFHDFADEIFAVLEALIEIAAADWLAYFIP